MARTPVPKTKKEQKDTEDQLLEDPNEQQIHMIIFRMGCEEYGIRIEQIKEVTVTPPISRVPRTASFIKGIANIRGDIIALMDLEERFNIRKPDDVPLEQLDRSYTLVIDTLKYTTGVMVREVPQSLTIGVSKIDTTPGLIKEGDLKSGFIDGIAKFANRLIIVLNMEKMLKPEEISMLQAEA